MGHVGLTRCRATSTLSGARRRAARTRSEWSWRWRCPCSAPAACATGMGSRAPFLAIAAPSDRTRLRVPHPRLFSLLRTRLRVPDPSYSLSTARACIFLTPSCCLCTASSACGSGTSRCGAVCWPSGSRSARMTAKRRIGYQQTPRFAACADCCVSHGAVAHLRVGTRVLNRIAPCSVLRLRPTTAHCASLLGLAGVPQVPRDHREERRMQPHDVQEVRVGMASIGVSLGLGEALFVAVLTRPWCVISIFVSVQ